MVTIKDAKFAESQDEFINSLFTSPKTCVGYARRLVRQVKLLDHQKNVVGVINKWGVICKARKLEDGRYWYSYGDIDIIGRLSVREIQEIVDELAVRREYRNGEKEYWFK